MLDIKHILDLRLHHLEGIERQGIIPSEQSQLQLIAIQGRIKELKFIMKLLEENITSSSFSQQPKSN
jgi:hypothetical protein